MKGNVTVLGRGTRAGPMDELRELITREVRIRFALRAEEFANRVQELAQGACRISKRSLRDHVAGLCLDDLYLATACTRSDERAWSELSATHFDFMRDFARRFLPHPAARDVADEVIADLWTHGKLQRYEGRSTLRTWLGTVIAHAALNSRKAMNRSVPLENEEARTTERKLVPLESLEPANEEVAALLRDMLSEAMRNLPPEERLMLQLYYEQGMTLDEMSVTVRASSAAVSRRLKRTRAELRARIDTLSRRQTGESAEALRAGLDLARIELDLGKLLGSGSAASGDRYEVV